MHFGDVEVRYLDGGGFRPDGGAMFGVVPKPLWEKKSPPDEKNRIRMRANALLVRAAGKTIVIETGNGTKWDAKQRAIYAVEEGDPLMAALGKAGVQPDEVDIVINTHLHFDHAGGNTHISGNRVVPTYRRARYMVQRAEFEHAQNPTDRDRASYFPENFQPIAEAGQWELIEGDGEILPGISVERIPGHNADMQAVKIVGGGPSKLPSKIGASRASKKLAFVADLLPTRHHIPLPWIMAYDLYPLQTLETKRKWVARLVNEGWITVFGHDPDIAAATLHQQNGKIEIEPVDLNR
ncbi:MAG TPA: MBL fold metallo-hydrolase [Verrucomicrobiae bacterium]|nr:MBL fold metallo-hydrolase [Verrucomicrobiae bacterium]